MGQVVAFPAPTPEPRPAPPEPLWREQVGMALRDARQAADLRLIDVAERAGVSPQYLSEVERGRKDPSSEILAAISGALDLRSVDIAVRAVEADRRGRRPGAFHDPVCLAA